MRSAWDCPRIWQPAADARESRSPAAVGSRLDRFRHGVGANAPARSTIHLPRPRWSRAVSLRPAALGRGKVRPAAGLGSAGWLAELGGWDRTGGVGRAWRRVLLPGCALRRTRPSVRSPAKTTRPTLTLRPAKPRQQRMAGRDEWAVLHRLLSVQE